MNTPEPSILRQREVEQLLMDHHHLRYREARAIVAADAIERIRIQRCTHRRWLRTAVLEFDVIGYLRNNGGHQGQASNPGPRASAATSAHCP